MIKSILSGILLLMVLVQTTSYGQEVYLSVAGKKAPKSSGNYNKLEIWVKPDKQSISTDLELFDGSLSNQADVIIGAANTVTTYDVYRTNNYYLSDGEVNNQAKSILSLSLTNEAQYANRWVNLTNLDKSAADGYIIVVSTSDFDDVNCFKIRADGWNILSNNLSMGLYNISANSQVQILPYEKFKDGIAFSVFGEEDSPVTLTDFWGNEYKQKQPVALMKNDYGLENEFGVSIKGSNFYINNLAVVSDKTMWWNLNSILITSVKNPAIKFSQSAGTQCNSTMINIVLISDQSVKKETVRYYAENKLFGQGISSEYFSAAPGVFGFQALLESENQYFPKYMIRNNRADINHLPVSRITGDKPIVAVSEYLTLYGQSSSDFEKQPLTYSWFVNGELRSKQMNYIFSGSTPGIYDIQLVVDDQSLISKCTTDTSSVIVRINAQPYGEILSVDKFSREETVTFKAVNVQDSDDSKLSYQWSGSGIVGESNKSDIKVKHNSGGKYSVNLVITDPSKVSNSSHKVSASYTVNTEPKPSFTIPELVAPNETVNLNASLSTDPDSRLLDYFWEISDGRNISEKNTSINFPNSGDYSVTLSINDNENVSNSEQSLTRKIHVNASPVPVIKANTFSSLSKQKFDASSSYDNETEIVSYVWDFGDGNRATGKIVNHTYQKSGEYIVKLTVNDGVNRSNSVQSETHAITINKYPVAVVTSAVSVEPNQSFSISSEKSYDPDGEIGSVVWQLNGKQISKKNTDQLSIKTPGDHYLALKVYDNSGHPDAFSVTTQKIHVNHPPVPVFSLNKMVADPTENIVFDASGSSDPDGVINSYTWSFEDGQSLTGKTIRRSFAKKGNHNFSLTVNDGKGFQNSSQTLNGSVLINSSPIIVAGKTIRSNSKRILLDASSCYDPDGQPVHVVWTLPNGEKISKTSFVWEPTRMGRQIVILSVDDQQNLKSSVTHQEIKIDINRPVVAVVDSIVRACTGQTILFNSAQCFDPDGDSFTTLWSFGDGTESSETNPAHIFKVPGNYSVELKLHDGFSEQPTITKIPVIIEGSPIAVSNISDTTICVNTPLVFDGRRSTDPNGKIGAYSWDFGDGETAYGATVTHLFSKSGVYNAVLNVIGTGSGTCSNINQTSSIIRVVEGPSVSITAKEIVSPGETVLISSSVSLVGSKIKQSNWIIDDGKSQTEFSGESINHVFAIPGEYIIRYNLVTDSKTNCNAASDQKKIRVNAAPTIVWNLPNYFPKGEFLSLDASSSNDPDGVIISYKWFLDGQLVAIDPLVSLLMNSPGKHNIKLVVTDNSKSKNQQTETEKEIFINSNPVAGLEFSKTIYEGEPVTFKPVRLTDDDKDSLTSILKINNKTADSYTAKLQLLTNHIVFIQNDNRKLPNSVDSVNYRIDLIPAPVFDFDFPPVVIAGYSLKLDSKLSDKKIVINNPENEYELKFPSAGTIPFELVWKPRSENLKHYPYSILVLDKVQFIQQPEAISAEWNPSNPEFVLEMPEINRENDHPIDVIWESGGKQIGIGKVINVRLKKGSNIFTVKCRDSEIPNSPFAAVQIIVVAE